MPEVVIGLGSNIEPRGFYLQMALFLIRERVGMVLRKSSVIETPAWGFEAPPFLNQVAVIRTELEPLSLLDELQSIERALGRKQKSTLQDGVPQYHNRTIDLDILDYDHLTYHDERLTLPHPKIGERDFVQQSLRELQINIPND
ncbi:MAG: 2-amino-4-hydroxy-6-hydroxymethyldihydropteridine diphosphokinase [Bacteroidales bacterium]|nr:2-amino-4-hydroxy-6-hydroxymethyldihydropteridine diphosphokinase [Bacteroidales bacterium]